MIQHAALGPERWRQFRGDQQILMIANEMHRGSRLLGPADAASRRLAYERVLRLVDLTVEVQTRSGLRRELLRWRDLVAALYLQPEPDPAEQRRVFRTLLQFTPIASRQIEPLLGR